jgi:hypothetical protein
MRAVERCLVDGVVGQEDAWRGISLPVGPEERYEASRYANTKQVYRILYSKLHGLC